MDAVAADLPLYLQMSRYTKGSKAVMELRTERYLAEQAAAAQSASQPAASDDGLITGSLGTSDADGHTGADDTNDDDGFSFDDFLDMINPLQHLPVVSTLYREMTGDEMGAAARVVGGAIYGGPIGAGVAVAEAVLEQATGDDVGGHVMSLLQGANTPPATAVAAASVPSRPSTQTAPANTVALDVQAGTPLPSLSAEAFNALLTDASDAEVPAAPRNPQHYALEREQSGVAAAMALALDQYDVLNLVDEPVR